MSDDTDKHERLELGGLHPEVIAWCERMAKSARKSEPPEVVRDFDRLLAMARGETAPASAEQVTGPGK